MFMLFPAYVKLMFIDLVRARVCVCAELSVLEVLLRFIKNHPGRRIKKLASLVPHLVSTIVSTLL